MPEPLFLGAWDDAADVARSFHESLLDTEILLAAYMVDDGLEGYAFVLFRKDGRLYEVNASHSSIYDLEGQWEPEEANVEELLHRVEHNPAFGGPMYHPRVRELLMSLPPHRR